MNVPIKVYGELREARIDYFKDSDVAFLDQWRIALGKDKHPIRTDAVDFAGLAYKRFATHEAVENYAQSPDEIGDYISDNPLSEVANLIVLKCDGFRESDVLGIAHFRRSWCNNLILDYLASHPWIAHPREADKRISGVGIGLLYFFSGVAIQYNVKRYGVRQLRIPTCSIKASLIWIRSETCCIFVLRD